MGKKQKTFKYKTIKKPIDTHRALYQAITMLDKASVKALEGGDAQAMATAGLGWAEVTRIVWNIQSRMEIEEEAELEVHELEATIEFANQVGFSPYREIEEDDDDED